eukprot:2220533-Amphidinium_carterae.1
MGQKYAVSCVFTHNPRTIELLSVGKLVTALLIPCVVQVLAHERCFGLWTQLWEPCQQLSDILNVRHDHHSYALGPH